MSVNVETIIPKGSDVCKQKDIFIGIHIYIHIKGSIVD